MSFSIGTTVRFEKSRDEIQTAMVYRVDPDSQSIVLQWSEQEDGVTVTKQKEVNVHQIVAFNPELVVPSANSETSAFRQVMMTTLSQIDNGDHEYECHSVQMGTVSSLVDMNIYSGLDPDSTMKDTEESGSLGQLQVNPDSLVNSTSDPSCHGYNASNNAIQMQEVSSANYWTHEYSFYQEQMMASNTSLEHKVEMMQVELHTMRSEQEENVEEIRNRLDSLEEKQSRSVVGANAAFGAFQQMAARQEKLELLQNVDRDTFRQQIGEVHRAISGLSAGGSPNVQARDHPAAVPAGRRERVKCSFCNGEFSKCYISKHKRKHCPVLKTSNGTGAPSPAPGGI